MNVYNGREIGGFIAICNGKCAISPHCGFSALTWICILIPSFLQFIFINPVFTDYSAVLQIINIATMTLSLVFLLITSCTEPGIIPRKTSET